MNSYRVALILCRAVAIALWWSAGIRIFSALTTIAAAFLGILGHGLAVAPLTLQGLLVVVPTVIIAGFLQIFAVSLAASMTGGGAFEGDSIALRRGLDATEKALACAGAGLFLLFFGAVSAIPATISGIYTLVFSGVGVSTGKTYLTYSLFNNALPSIFQCIVGFILAFSLGLRRALNSQKARELGE